MFYDCEPTGSNIHKDHVIEIWCKVVAVSDAVSISTTLEYSSLIHSSRATMLAALYMKLHIWTYAYS